MINDSQGVLESHTVLVSLELIVMLLTQKTVDPKEHACFECKKAYMVASLNKENQVVVLCINNMAETKAA